NDRVGSDFTSLGNGNYVVSSPGWNSTRGAVTWGDSRTGVSGVVSGANSLIGSNPGDSVGSCGLPSCITVTTLSNGNYVVRRPLGDGGRGAATWGDGRIGVRGTISDTNSLVGSSPDDRVGGSGVTLLSNGNYVIRSTQWNGARGAVTWADGRTGVSGIVSNVN